MRNRLSRVGVISSRIRMPLAGAIVRKYMSPRYVESRSRACPPVNSRMLGRMTAHAASEAFAVRLAGRAAPHN